MPSLRKSLDDLKAQAQQTLKRSGIITNLNEGGVARSLLDVTALQLSELYDALSFQGSMGRLSTAAGVFLDLIGQSRGVSRSASNTAVVSQDDENIKYYSVDGTTPIKTLLPDGKVPSGSIVSSTDGAVSYEITEDVFPDDVQIELFVPASSLLTGAAQNVGRGVLNTHDLGTTEVAVVNTESINTGQDTESDTDYRFRISRTFASSVGATEDAVKAAALSFPGVASVTVRNFSDGVGTFEVVVVPIGNRAAPGLLKAIEASISRVAPFGVRFSVTAPAELTVQLILQLEFRKDVTALDRTRIRDLARQSILAYLSAISVGGIFVLNVLTQRILDVSPQIFDMKVLLYRFRGENQVLRNVEAAENEVFVPDTLSSNAIVVL